MEQTLTTAKAVLEILQREGFYNLTGYDGCLCAHIVLKGIALDVHCWKTVRDHCKCRWAGIHITPESSDTNELLAIGELIRTEINRPDMNIKIIIHSSPDEDKQSPLIFDAPTPEGGFEYDDEVDRLGLHNEHHKL